MIFSSRRRRCCARRPGSGRGCPSSSCVVGRNVPPERRRSGTGWPGRRSDVDAVAAGGFAVDLQVPFDAGEVRVVVQFDELAVGGKFGETRIWRLWSSAPGSCSARSCTWMPCRAAAARQPHRRAQAGNVRDLLRMVSAIRSPVRPIAFGVRSCRIRRRCADGVVWRGVGSAIAGVKRRRAAVRSGRPDARRAVSTWRTSVSCASGDRLPRALT